MTLVEIHEGNSLVADDIRSALKRLIASDQFKDSPQLSSFIKFVVEQTLEGKGDQLKGYTIATLALGRSEDFDPQIDPIVRVQAGRVRHAIDEFYQANPDDPVRIHFAKGSYQPQFFAFQKSSEVTLVDDALPDRTETRRGVDIPDVVNRDFHRSTELQRLETPTTSHVMKRRRSTFRMTYQGLVGLATVAAIMGIISVFLLGFLTNKPSSVTPAVQQSYFPVVVVENENGPSDPTELLAVSQRTQDALARFDDILIVRDSSDERGSSQLDPVRRKAKRLSLRITGRYADRGRVRFNARLVEQFDQSVVWSQEFDPVLSGTAGDEERSEIVRAIATAIARPYGVIHSHARRVFSASAEMESDFGCIMIAFDYWQRNTKDMRANAKKCLEEQLKVNPRLGVLHSQLAYLYLDDIIVDNIAEPRAALDAAIAAATRGSNLAPTSARSYQTLMAAHFVRKEVSSAWRAAETAMKLNPFDTDIMADVAVHYVRAGQYEKGLDLINKSIVFNSNPPDWVLTYRSLALYMLGRNAEAAGAVSPLGTSEYPLAMMGNILVAFSEDDRVNAIKAINAFKNKHPVIFANPEAYTERINLERGLARFLLSRYKTAIDWAG